jgi:glyoxylase-like metal-dependent hydrolase (beta-lactamase superfamily II)
LINKDKKKEPIMLHHIRPRLQSLLVAGLLAVSSPAVTLAQNVVTSTGPDAPLTLSVYTSDAYGYAVTSTVVYGEREAMLIDPQFLRTPANEVVDLIRSTGRELTLIYSTHAHPDHFLGVAAILEAFPNARYVALPEVRERMVTSWPGRRNFWYPTYGDELPGEEAILPEALSEPKMMLEGYEFLIIGEQIGLDGAGNSFVWIPAIKAAVTGDIIFNSHLRPPAETAPLYETLDRIAALGPEIVVAGHQARGTANDPQVLNFIREYIGAFRMARQTSPNWEELAAKMKVMYPGLGREDALEQAAQRAYE